MQPLLFAKKLAIVSKSAPLISLSDENSALALDASEGVRASTTMYAEVEKRVFSNPKIEGVALRYGFFYGPGTWY